MFDFSSDPAAPKADLYADLASAADALTAGEPDGVANMANIAALIWQWLPDLNWAGFYRLIGDELVLGPFCGKPACIRIALGQGVCGTAAAAGASVLVPDVHTFPGHIACGAGAARWPGDCRHRPRQPPHGPFRCRGPGWGGTARPADRHAHLSAPFRDGAKPGFA